jgi:hypothetical protein
VPRKDQASILDAVTPLRGDQALRGECQIPVCPSELTALADSAVAERGFVAEQRLREGATKTKLHRGNNL